MVRTFACHLPPHLALRILLTGGPTASWVVGALERGIEDSHRFRLKALMGDYDRAGALGVGHVRKGDPAEVILAAAEAYQVDVTVMGTQGRRGLAGFFMGNTAEEVLKRTSASVLAIKPDDFRSPVEPEA